MSVRRSSGDAIAAEDVVLTRVFDAPRDLVFEVWTKAEHFSRWFGPHDVDVVACELDARPGGIIRFGHRFRDGTTFYLKGAFSELVLNERLVFSFGFVDEDGHPVQHPMFPEWPLDVSIETIVVLDDFGAGTRVRLVHRVHPDDDIARQATERWSPRARQGSIEVLDRLGEYLAATRKASTP